MAQISLNNGFDYMDADELSTDVIQQYWPAIVSFMDAATLEQGHTLLAPCEPRELLEWYLAQDVADLVIG